MHMNLNKHVCLVIACFSVHYYILLILVISKCEYFWLLFVQGCDAGMSNIFDFKNVGNAGLAHQV